MLTAGCSPSPSLDSEVLKESSATIEQTSRNELDREALELSEKISETGAYLDRPEVIAASNSTRTNTSAIIDECKSSLEEVDSKKTSISIFGVHDYIRRMKSCNTRLEDSFVVLEQEVKTVQAAQKKTADSEKIDSETEGALSDLEAQLSQNINRNEALAAERFREAKRIQGERSASASPSTPSPKPTPVVTSKPESTPDPETVTPDPETVAPEPKPTPEPESTWSPSPTPTEWEPTPSDSSSTWSSPTPPDGIDIEEGGL